ncbi:hypothetical protein BB561_006198 [Smittium simulii]|uniref:Uncharacterized protein n=1 Tax=Smittium simulii TaxID=133385 RepID=A0A2T9Y5X0_9FUNG|nr:hypothetical protein BB561_006198 [Smittium simulii]
MSLKLPSDKKLGKLYWKGTSNVGCSLTWLSNAEKTFGIEKKFLEKTKIMGCHGDSEQPSNSELRIRETEFTKMERSIVSTRDSRNGNLYRCQQTAWGIVVVSQSYLGFLFRQHYDPGIRTEIWGNYLSQITRSLRKTVVSLYRDKHTSSDVLCTNVHQPGRCAIKTNSTNGMLSINRDIQETEQNIWPIRFGSVCNNTEQEAAQILQLVPGQSIIITRSILSSVCKRNSPLLNITKTGGTKLSNLFFKKKLDSKSMRNTRFFIFKSAKIDYSDR